eukprot:scaffold380_cov272-Pinguiococcus_pyrenoidosus.AAC.11
MREVRQNFLMYTGRPDTKWERLYRDPFVERTVYYWNTETQELREGDHAVCENCDGMLEDEDIACFDCGQERSEANMVLYKQAVRMKAGRAGAERVAKASEHGEREAK